MNYKTIRNGILTAITCLAFAVNASAGVPFRLAPAEKPHSVFLGETARSEFYGISGYYVLKMQEWLNQHGELLVLNGNWDDRTEAAYQRHVSEMEPGKMPLKGYVPQLVKNKTDANSEHYSEMGLEVLRVQKMLTAKGFKVDWDAMWGPETEIAYKDYLESLNLNGTTTTPAVTNNADNSLSTEPEFADDGTFDNMKDEFAFDYDLNNAIDDDYGQSNQSVSGLLFARGDVYAQQANYAFSPARFQLRGYEQWYHNTYINGVHFNGLERGSFNYSMLGGLNYATRNREVTRSMESCNYSFGSVGTTNDITTRASGYARGGAVSLSAANTSYYLRLQASYATGLNAKGWAFMFALSARYAHESMVQGSPYQSIGYFASIEKQFQNGRHILALTTFGAPTLRGQQSAVTSEVTDLIGTRYYNSYWGYQNGRKRNSRIVKSFDPVAILNYDFNINKDHLLRMGLGFHYSLYSNSALNFYNAPDPRPDYYRFLPSYLNDGHYDETGTLDPSQVNVGLQDQMTEWWSSRNPDVTQVNWEQMYQANYRNNEVNPTGSAKYMLERRHNDLQESMFNVNYNGRFVDEKLKLQAGVHLKQSAGKHYKTVDDLLGANQWIDIDQFAERDLTGGSLPEASSTIILNNMGEDSVVGVGDRFGYDYTIHSFRAGAWLQNEWNFNHVSFFYALMADYTQFYRYGHMENGRAHVLGVTSKGKGSVYKFLDPGVKAGITWRINGRNIIQANILAKQAAPQAYNAYVSPRIKDTRVSGLDQERILSYDLSYNFSFPKVRGRIALYQTHVQNAVELSGFYNDEYRTFTNVSMSGIDKIYRGVEVGLSVKAGQYFTVVAAGTYADNRYTDNAVGVLSPENGSFDDIKDVVELKDVHLSTGPQAAVCAGLKFFHPKMWFADVTLSYLSKNFLSIAPSRFMQSNMDKYRERSFDVVDNDGNYVRTKYPALEALGTQERLKGGFLLDCSVGHLIYFKNSQSLSINLSVNNLLNTRLVTGGYQQGRVPVDSEGVLQNNYNKYPNKYYYNQGVNFFLNLGYKF